MWRKAAILALWLLGVVGAIVLVVYEVHDSIVKHQSECYETSAAIAGNHSTEKNQPGTDQCQDPKNYMPWWYPLVAWPEGFTVWAIIATLFVIGWQSFETRKAADAALLNAEALIISERPWLVINCGPTPGNPEEYCVEAVNVGRTPAEICDARCAFAVHPMDFNEPPTDLNVVPSQLLLYTFLVTGKDTELARLNLRLFFEDELLRQSIEGATVSEARGRHAVFIYGCISYWDTFTDRSKPDTKPYETRWIYRYNPWEIDHRKSLEPVASRYERHK